VSCVLERSVARSQGVWDERDLAEAAADFYLLENLAAGGDDEAARKLARLEEQLASEFVSYLDMAIGGELRHARRHLGEDALPRDIACFFREVCPGHRGKAWLVWTVVRRGALLRLPVEGELRWMGLGVRYPSAAPIPPGRSQLSNLRGPVLQPGAQHRERVQQAL
jgi:hypothetical protein